MNETVWVGIDVGSITCKIAVIDEKAGILATTYRRTQGRVIDAVKQGLAELTYVLADCAVGGCVTTGSGRQLAAALVGADAEKNEISAHARAVLHLHPEARTILEIGGEDSKIILLRDGIPVDFAMNTVCAAGTGAFLDQLAARLDIRVEDLGHLAAASRRDVAIAGRCTVFAESDIIFKQQTGHRIEDIVAGACRALVRNYLNDVGKGKHIEPPILFLGGVAANTGIRRAFADALGHPVTIPDHHNVMGAFGAALVAREGGRRQSSMRDLKDIQESDFRVRSFTCPHCPNACEVLRFSDGVRTIAHLGGRCDRWTDSDRSPVNVGSESPKCA